MTRVAIEPPPCRICRRPVYGHVPEAEAHRACTVGERERQAHRDALEAARVETPELFGPDGKLINPFALGGFEISREAQAARDADNYELGVYFSGVDSHNWHIPRLTRAAVRYRSRFLDGERGPVRCEECGGPPDDMHHLNYDREGHETPEDLILLCRDCHRDQHPGWTR